MADERKRFDIRMWNDSRLIGLCDIIPAVRSNGLQWMISDAWVMFQREVPDDVLQVMNAAEGDQVPIEWSTVEEIARWSTQCIDLTLRGYENPGDAKPAIEIVAFDSTAWEFTINDSGRLDTNLLRDLGGVWVLVNERGEIQALIDE